MRKVSGCHSRNRRILFAPGRRIFFSPPGFGSPGELTFPKWRYQICYSMFSGPEPSPAASRMKRVAAWMCVHTLLLLTGEASMRHLCWVRISCPLLSRRSSQLGFGSLVAPRLQSGGLVPTPPSVSRSCGQLGACVILPLEPLSHSCHSTRAELGLFSFYSAPNVQNCRRGNHDSCKHPISAILAISAAPAPKRAAAHAFTKDVESRQHICRNPKTSIPKRHLAVSSEPRRKGALSPCPRNRVDSQDRSNSFKSHFWLLGCESTPV